MLLFGNCFVFIWLLKNYYNLFALEKKGRENFSCKNPRPRPSSKIWREMWLDQLQKSLVRVLP